MIGTFNSAATCAISGSLFAPQISLIICAPASTAARATLALYVSTEIMAGTSASNAFITGTMRAISSSSEMRS